MRAIFITLAFVTMAGCTTVSDLLKEEPVLKATTSKPAKAYSLCVFQNWQDKKPNAHMSETNDGYRLLTYQPLGEMPDELLDVKASPEGTRVAFFERMPWITMGRGVYKEAVQDCL